MLTKYAQIKAKYTQLATITVFKWNKAIWNVKVQCSPSKMYLLLSEKDRYTLSGQLASTLSIANNVTYQLHTAI